MHVNFYAVFSPSSSQILPRCIILLIVVPSTVINTTSRIDKVEPYPPLTRHIYIVWSIGIWQMRLYLSPN
jgi:hypothetical protein